MVAFQFSTYLSVIVTENFREKITDKYTEKWNFVFFKTTRDIPFQSYVQRLFSVDELIVLLEGNMARNPEFDYDRFELADIDNSECKANCILKTGSARVS